MGIAKGAAGPRVRGPNNSTPARREQLARAVMLERWPIHAAVDLEGLTPVAGGFGFVCTPCGATNVLAPVPGAGPDEVPAPQAPAEAPAPSAPAPAPSPPLPPGMTECPKCAHRQYEHDACHRCGLDLERFRSGKLQALLDPLAGHPLADELRARWAALSGQLDDTQGHRDFIALCAEHGLLEFAGQCYRKAAAGREEDARVTAYRERVIQAALVRVGQLEGRAQAVLNTRVKSLILVAVLAFIFLAFAIGFWLMSRYQTQWQAAG